MARLQQAGATIFAKTNMSEFAYPTLGLIAHFGTPANPWSPEGETRSPGGSSSGAADTTARGLGDIAIATDTAGSSRIPAALFCVIGIRIRSTRVSTEGIFPLSDSHDAVGMMARSLAP